MRISLLCSDERHPVNGHLKKWMARNIGDHQVELARRKEELSGGDILFLVSCSEVVRAAERSAYKVALVLHASDLPKGRGWSPHIWEIINGASTITLSLIEAADSVDSGRIWKKVTLAIPPHALWHEINKQLFDAQVDLMDFAVREFGHIEPVAQDPAIEPTYYPRRSPDDSRIDPSSSIASQFNKIRVCDPDRFPAFFELHGKTFKLTIEKIDE